LKSGTGNRFSKANRLLDAAAFARVFKQASRSRDPLFTVLCRHNNSPLARLGLAISKKHCRQAVRRNRIKRIVRESFRQHQELLAGLDVVVINRPAASGASRPQLADSLDRHWQRCHALHTRGPQANG
jgi:ribonuclease P protein component